MVWIFILYLGALGTTRSLGLIALYQNKKYKEISENSDTKFIKLQKNIKDLTEKSVGLIAINTKIENAKYFPIMTEIAQMNYDSFKISSLETDSFQMTIFDGTPEDINRLSK